METHSYGVLRFIVPVEGKKVYSLLPTLQNHPFTLQNTVNIINRAWEIREGDILFLREKENRAERQKSYNWEWEGELGGKEKPSKKHQGFGKGETLRQQNRIKITESSERDTM